MTHHCPLCGKSWADPRGFALFETRVIWKWQELPLSPMAVRLFTRLYLSRGTPVNDERLFFALYDDREDGGPSIEILKVLVCNLRKVFVRFGIPYEILRTEKPYKSYGFGSYTLIEHVPHDHNPSKRSQTLHP